MALEIERRFEVELPLALFLERRTVARIAEWLRSRAAAPGFLVPVQPGGCRPPLFVVPGGYGNVLFLRDLARYLGPDQPVFALQSTRSAAGLRQYYLEVEEVAATYLEEIRRQQPSGPYLLAGYSFGGYVALEMAHRLRDQGQPVDLLVLLDTYPPGPRRAATPGQRWHLHADNLRRLPLGRWPEYAAGNPTSAGIRWSAGRRMYVVD
jgi:pimeloyl-ACP methyl ester carboxylesterase